MRRAMELAELGRGWTKTNPVVGAVLVKEDRIIGEGYHKKYGELHAERNAIASLTESAEGAVIYVTLEPCIMCSGAVVQSRIRRVFFGAYDIENGYMASNFVPGLKLPECYCGIMEEECKSALVKFFDKLRK